MILCFPDFDTLRLAVTGGLLPAEMIHAPAAVGRLPNGGHAVEASGKLPKKTATELSKLNVTGAKAMPADAVKVSCWFQILPLVKDTSGASLTAQTPVLFELDSPADLTALVAEMLRLGNDRQGFRWMQESDTQKILLRVIGPPYYTTLRALDQLPTEAGGRIRAYVEQSPRFWVQLGYRHPLANTFQVPEDRCVLVRPPQDWTYLAEAPFRDAYEILDFQLPDAPTDWQAVQEVPKFEVPLTLVAGNAADAAELWVFHEGARAQLDTFVRDSDERLIQRLRFVVVEGNAGESRIVLRVAPSKLPLPVLSLSGGVGYKPYQKLANLFLPVGQRLHPQLRRDAVRSLLASDTNRCFWLMPQGNGRFVPESVAEEAFRPLEDWVEYQIGLAHEPLKAWIAGMQFDFQSFQCTDTGAPRPKTPPDDRSNRSQTSTQPIRVPAEAKDHTKPSDAAPQFEVLPFEPEQKAPGEWHKLRLELQTQFLNTAGSLDDPAKKSLWPQLARANSGVGDVHEAALCWLSAIWEYERPPEELVDGWRSSEGITGSDWDSTAAFDAMRQLPNPSVSDIRRFACLFFALAIRPQPPAWLMPLLPEVQRYFEGHDGSLPLRAAWLAGVRLARLAGGDALGLARLRDRLLERLIEHGLNPEIDLPFFLRNSESDQSETLRFIRAKTAELHKCVKLWAANTGVAASPINVANVGQSLPYIDLLFAFAFAKMGEIRTCRELVDEAKALLLGPKPELKFQLVGEFLHRAFLFRIENAIAGKNTRGPMEQANLHFLAELQTESKNVANSQHGTAFQVITRMREESRILEPVERFATYELYSSSNLEVHRLQSIFSPAELSRETKRLWKDYSAHKNPLDSLQLKASLLRVALPLSPRVGEAFALELVRWIPNVFPDPIVVDPLLQQFQSQALERGLFIASEYGSHSNIRMLIDLFMKSFNAFNDHVRSEWAVTILRESLRSLYKLRFHNEALLLLKEVESGLLKNTTLEQFQLIHQKSPATWSKGLQALLYVAGGYMRYNKIDKAMPILDFARKELYSKTTKLLAIQLTPIAAAYIHALGQGSPEFGLKQISELFQRLNPAHVWDNFLTAKFYSRFQLKLVEETVLAIIGDDSAFGATGQRWLEDDEFIVRRQIHRDMKWLLHHAGA